MALDFTCRAMRQARSRSPLLAGVGVRVVATRPLSGSSAAEVGSSHQHTATGGADFGEGVDRRRSIGLAVGSRAQAGSSRMRRFGFEARMAAASGSTAGRGQPPGRSRSGARPARRPPVGHRHDAAEGTHRVAGQRPLPGVTRSSASAAPHGLVCLTTTQAGPMRSWPARPPRPHRGRCCSSAPCPGAGVRHRRTAR